MTGRVFSGCPCDLCRSFVACPVNPNATVDTDFGGDVFDPRAQVGPWATSEGDDG